MMLDLPTRAHCAMPGGGASVNRLLHEDMYFVEARGAAIRAADGRVFTDYHCAFGATIIEHADPEIAARVLGE